MKRTTNTTNTARNNQEQSGLQSSPGYTIQAICMYCGKDFWAPKPYSKFCTLTCAYADRKGKSRYRDTSLAECHCEKHKARHQHSHESKEAIRLTKRDVANALRRCGLYSGIDGTTVRKI